jgi:TRAP-type C4-dicarboxylate transport system permease small subunit
VSEPKESAMSHLTPRTFDRIAARAAGAAAYLGGVGIVVLMLATVTDVATRAAGQGGVSGLLDLTEISLVFVVYFGFAQAEADKTHIRTSFVTERMPERLRNATLALVWMLCLVFLVWMVWLTAQQAYTAYDVGESRASQTGVPVWPARVMVSLGMLGLALQSLVNVVDALRGIGPSAPDKVKEAQS